MDAPIQNLDRIDIVGTRRDAGIDLVVVCSGPLDESADTLARLNQKVHGYLDTACSGGLWKAYPKALPGPIRIFLSCAHPISTGAQGLINSLKHEAEARGVELRVVKSMSAA